MNVVRIDGLRAAKKEGYFKGSPPADPDFLDNFEWTPELLRDYADRARQVIDTLWSTDVAELERVDGDAQCDECNVDTLVRFRYGHFTLCRACARRRRRVLAMLEAEEARAA
jgi:hypothetical protein